MKTYVFPFIIEENIKVQAETLEEAQAKVDRLSITDIAAIWGVDGLEIRAPYVEGEEPEGLSRLKDSEMVRI